MGLLIASRGHNAQQPDAGRSATRETESRQHVLTGENGVDSTGRVVHIHSWVWLAARMAIPGAGTILADRLTHHVQIMNTTWSRSYNGWFSSYLAGGATMHTGDLGVANPLVQQRGKLFRCQPDN
jgi:hypothetical protein